MEGHQSARVLRYMARRPPVDDERLREQLRQRLNPFDGVNIPADTLALRLSIVPDVLTEDEARRRRGQGTVRGAKLRARDLGVLVRSRVPAIR